MAEKKNYRTDNKSFMLYKDWEEYFEALGSCEEAGRLVMALFAFAKRGEQPEFTGALKMAFLMMSGQLERDGEKWEDTCEVRAKCGALGGRPRKKPNGFSENQMKAKKPDTDTDKDTETDTVIDTVTEKDTEAFPAPAPAQTNTNNNIFISEEAKRFLCDKYGSELVDEYITRVRDYCKNTGKRYSDPASTISKWIEQDKAKGFIPAKKPGYEPYCSEQPSFDIDEWYRTADARVDAYMESLGVS